VRSRAAVHAALSTSCAYIVSASATVWMVRITAAAPATRAIRLAQRLQKLSFVSSSHVPRFCRRILQDVADVAKARTWLGSEDLKAAMQMSGVWRSGRAHADLQKEKSPGHRVWGDGRHARGFHCRNGDATKH
jgi:hypothetical protein